MTPANPESERRSRDDDRDDGRETYDHPPPPERRGRDNAPGFGRRSDDAFHGQMAEMRAALDALSARVPPAPMPEPARPATTRGDVVKVASVVGAVMLLLGYALSALRWAGEKRQAPGDRFAAVEARVTVLEDKARVGIDERRQFHDGLVSVAGKLGRVSCRQINEQEASDLGIPCRLLREGGPWPLFPNAAAPAGLPRVGPLRSPLGAPDLGPFLAALLIPVAPRDP